MTRRRIVQSVAVLYLCVPMFLGAGPGVRLIDGARRAVAALRSDGQTRQAAAEAAAARFIAGGRLLAAGSIPLFDVEWTNRSGGLMAPAAVRDPGSLAASDVLVYGCFRGAEAGDAAFLNRARARGTLVIAFGTKSQAARLGVAADFFLAADPPAGLPLAAQASACVQVAHLWAFTGELVAACTRSGKMPTLWQSIKVPGSAERNARFRPLRFHEETSVKPVGPGRLGDLYLDDLIGSLEALAKDGRPLEAAGRIIRQTREGRRTVFHANLGHFEPARLLPEDFPVRVETLPVKAPEIRLREAGAAGDSLFAIWYHELPAPLLEAARDKGLKSIVVAGRNPFAPFDPSPADVYLDPRWQVGDAIVEVPGYDIRILPPSAVLNGLLFYAVIAEALPSSSS